MFENIKKELVGLEVVEVYAPGDGSLALLFEDGNILYVGGEHGIVFAKGPGWEEMWASLKR